MARFLDNGVKALVEVTLAPYGESGCEVTTEIDAWDPSGATEFRAGDSGAPLFIDAEGTWKVAGVCDSIQITARLRSGRARSR